ncbi:hypothetical protein [Methanospirillum stamsii]|uniref:hypothetical protein n=1 Tax=Methanospirillum stamsii TaxID=1277351 RepID=UPI001FE4C908|nr:hypothetical protein [Methanospirillum stamsii]
MHNTIGRVIYRSKMPLPAAGFQGFGYRFDKNQFIVDKKNFLLYDPNLQGIFTDSDEL